MSNETKRSGRYPWGSVPPEVGKHEKLREDGSYGYVCNACGYPVDDHDGYCSECGARVSGTYFYYGMDRNPNKKPKRKTFADIVREIETEISNKEKCEEN